jgi:transcriptional regulator with XRE-family HTH domain
MDQDFGPRLRKERERRKISLDSIAASTKVSLSLFEALERNDVSRWPTGIFRRSFMRAYATGIGLDADVIVREFLERFPDPADAASEAAAGLSANDGAAKASVAGLRLKLADAPRSFAAGRILSSVRERAAAVSFDAAVVLVVGALLFVSLDKFWVPLAIFMCCYYWGSILIVGNTPGVCLLAPSGPVDRSGPPNAARRGNPVRALLARVRLAGNDTVAGSAPRRETALARSK